MLAWFLCVITIWNTKGWKCKDPFVRAIEKDGSDGGSRRGFSPCREAASTAPRRSASARLSLSWGAGDKRRRHDCLGPIVVLKNKKLWQSKSKTAAAKERHVDACRCRTVGSTWWWSARFSPASRRSSGPCRSVPSPWLLPGRPPPADGHSGLKTGEQDVQRRRVLCFSSAKNNNNINHQDFIFLWNENTHSLIEFNLKNF